VPGKNIPDHHGSHQDLLWSPPACSSFAHRGVDAIVVPTFRRPAYLAEAADLARTLNCFLVTLHSGPWTTAAKAAERLPADVNLIAIDVPSPTQLNLPCWGTSRMLAETVFARRTDLSTKRNLALMLSHMAGWSRILFLDDDITSLNPDDVRKASSLLDTHNAVGLRVCGFPDHSVVCHAYREAGGEQQSFIGGGALVTEVNRSNSFFPDIYNDDWFFLLDGRKSLQPVAVTGQVIQYPYDPFRNPDRARAEELGDVLAEGIYWLLDQGQSIAAADEAYWAGYLVKRRRFIEGVLEMVKDNDSIERHDRARMIAALKGSLGRLMVITPTSCEGYLRAWADDRQRWLDHVEQLPSGQELPRALPSLSRRGCPPLKWRLGGKIGRSVRAKAYPQVALGPPGKSGRSAASVVR
jgi:hypothetical protein